MLDRFSATKDDGDPGTGDDGGLDTIAVADVYFFESFRCYFLLPHSIMNFIDMVILILLVVILLVIISNFLIAGRDLAVYPVPRYRSSKNSLDYYPNSYYNSDDDYTDDEDNNGDYGRHSDDYHNGYNTHQEYRRRSSSSRQGNGNGQGRDHHHHDHGDNYQHDNKYNDDGGRDSYNHTDD